jgi:hypothetical protein
MFYAITTITYHCDKVYSYHINRFMHWTADGLPHYETTVKTSNFISQLIKVERSSNKFRSHFAFKQRIWRPVPAALCVYKTRVLWQLYFCPLNYTPAVYWLCFICSYKSPMGMFGFRTALRFFFYNSFWNLKQRLGSHTGVERGFMTQCLLCGELGVQNTFITNSKYTGDYDDALFYGAM